MVLLYIYGNMDPINIPQMLAYIAYMDPSWVMANSGVLTSTLFNFSIHGLDQYFGRVKALNFLLRSFLWCPCSIAKLVNITLITFGTFGG